MTEKEEAFRRKLLRCKTLQDMFALLEVPGEEVTQYSAAFALQRLCPLRPCKYHPRNFDALP